MFKKTATAALTAVAALTAAPTAAHANLAAQPAPCIESHDIIGASFNVKKCGVDDIDQFRVGLAGNGNAHCGPASLFNIVRWFDMKKGADMGWGSDLFQNIDPKDPADFSKATTYVWHLGYDAGMTSSGSNTVGNRHAFSLATKPATDKGWTFTSGGVDSKNDPDFAGTLAKKLFKAPVQLYYGRYKLNYGSWERDGGHIITVTSAKGNFNGTSMDLTVMDPGRAADHNLPSDVSDKYLTTQSAYQSENIHLEKQLIKEYIRNADDPDTAEDESITTIGKWRDVWRWKLTGPNYTGTTTQFVEAFNWFDADAPGGGGGH